MSVSAVKGFMGVAIAIAVAMLFAAASHAFGRNESLAFFLGSCAVIVVAILWYRRAMPAAESREEERQAQQLVELKQQLNLMGEPVSVQASSGLPLLALLVGLSIFYGLIGLTRPDVGSMLVFAIVVFLTVVVAFNVLPRVGKPALTIRPDGLATAVYGFFRWEEIESIGLHRHTSRNATTHSLDLYVPRLSDRKGQMHPLTRAMRRIYVPGLRPNFVVIPLANASLPAALVHALCYDLWKERTGRTESWTSALSQHQIEQLRRSVEHLEMLKRVGEETDPDEMMKRLEKIKERFGDPSTEPEPKKRLSARAAKHRDALLAELRTIDAGNHAARQRLLDKHTKAYMRETTAKWAIFALVLAVLMVGAFVLFGE